MNATTQCPKGRERKYFPLTLKLSWKTMGDLVLQGSLLEEYYSDLRDKLYSGGCTAYHMWHSRQITFPTHHTAQWLSVMNVSLTNGYFLFVDFFSPFSLKLKIFFKRATLILKVSYKLHKVFHEGTKNVHLPNTNLIPHNSCCFVPGSCKQRLPSCRG